MTPPRAVVEAVRDAKPCAMHTHNVADRCGGCATEAASAVLAAHYAAEVEGEYHVDVVAIPYPCWRVWRRDPSARPGLIHIAAECDTEPDARRVAHALNWRGGMMDYGNRCAGCGGGPARFNAIVGEWQCDGRRVGACPTPPSGAEPRSGDTPPSAGTAELHDALIRDLIRAAVASATEEGGSNAANVDMLRDRLRDELRRLAAENERLREERP